MNTSAATAATITRCPRCRRVLRSARSIAAGVGPTCKAKIAAAAKTTTAKPAQVAKAQELIELGAIVPVRAHRARRPRVFRVVSTDGTRTYLTAATGQCNCAAGLKGRDCYHAFTARLIDAA